MRRLSAVVLAFLFLGVTPAFGAVFESADTLILSEPVADNLYVSGGSLTIESPVSGDLVIFGGQMTVSGKIEGNLEAAGGQIRIDGSVARNMRVAGGTISIGGSVGGDLLVAGGQITVESGAVIDGDLVAMGGSVMVRGTIRGRVIVGGEQVILGGTFLGPVEARASELLLNGSIGGVSILAAERITLGSRAELKDHADYWTEKGEMDFSPAIRSGSGSATYNASLEREHNDKETDRASIFGFIAAATLYTLLASALLILLLSIFFRPVFSRAGTILAREPMWSFLLGSLYVAATPVLILLLMATLIGIPLGLFILCFYAFSWIFSGALISMTLAALIEQYGKKEWRTWVFVLVSIALAFVLKLLWFIPVFGWIALTVLFLLAIGALVKSLSQTARTKR